MEWRNPNGVEESLEQRNLNGVEESQLIGGIQPRIPLRKDHLERKNPERNPIQQADGGIPEDPKGRILGEITREEPRHIHNSFCTGMSWILKIQEKTPPAAVI